MKCVWQLVQLNCRDTDGTIMNCFTLDDMDDIVEKHINYLGCFTTIDLLEQFIMYHLETERGESFLIRIPHLSVKGSLRELYFSRLEGSIRMPKSIRPFSSFSVTASVSPLKKSNFMPWNISETSFAAFAISPTA